MKKLLDREPTDEMINAARHGNSRKAALKAERLAGKIEGLEEASAICIRVGEKSQTVAERGVAFGCVVGIRHMANELKK